MNSMINISPKTDKKSVEHSKNAIIEVINACDNARLSNKVVIKALEMLGQSMTASADGLTISGCNFTTEEKK